MKQQSTINSASGFGLQPTHEQISRRAEELWTGSGRPPDRDQEIWLEAERQLQRGEPAARGSAATPSRTTTTRRSSGRVGSG